MSQAPLRCWKRNQGGSHQPLLQALLVVLLSGTAHAWSLSFLPARDTLPRQLALPEQMLVQALMEIADNRTQAALERIEKLLAVSPNFRLAQLIRGDLLLARGRPIDSLGAGAPPERVDELRAEARTRLARYAFQPPTHLVPKNLLALAPHQKHALVIDTSRSTLFVFANTDGGPKYLADFYVTLGKNGIEKVREGDKKTPLGVYRVIDRLPKDRLSDFYGAGAFPIDYPNEWDRARGRSGYGIWLHGTPLDTYSRPPRASDGCVVLANEDLEALADYLEPGSTPVVIARDVEWIAPEVAAALRAQLLERIERWRKDWESRDTEQYLSHYSRRFSGNGADLAKWAAQKRQVNAAKTWIRVRISDVSMFLYPGEGTMAEVTFEQDYASSNLSNRMKKRQYWMQEGEGWKIVYEGAA
ncbi:MAG TPA: L,D-transpeptidase [Burkholderiales bacterium]|nr:L,D-transpeptidase [Burkholderiales bacterium]